MGKVLSLLRKTEIEKFVKDWTSQNVCRIPGVDDLPCEVDRWAAGLTGDARALGISGSDIYLIVGDIDDFLTQQYRRHVVEPSPEPPL